MYTVDRRDRVTKLRNVPQSSVGAPLPVVIADDYRVLVAYRVETIDPSWDGSTVRIVDLNTKDETVAVVAFELPRAHLFGAPNDEAFAGHPLANRGLHPYGAFEVHESSWIRKLERMNTVHPSHTPAMFAKLRHFVLAFHDSTFECVARSIQFELRSGSMAGAIRELADRIIASAS